MGLSDVARSWDRLGREDPLWAVLTDFDKRHNRWSPEEFLATGEREIRAVLDRLDMLEVSVRTAVALDFGCGAGRLTQGLVTAGFETAVGVDISEGMIATAADLVIDRDRCEFLVNTRADLGAVADSSVDFVYSCRVLQHMPSELAHVYVREFFRIARPGATVVFQLPSRPSRNLQGLAVRLLPSQLANVLRRGMEMHGSSPDAVRSLIADCDGELIAIDDDSSAGPRWESHLYISRRHPG